MEKPISADDVKIEDLAKLPKGPREIFLREFPRAELIRLVHAEKVPESIKKSLNDPQFWIDQLRQDKFLLPADALGFFFFLKQKDQSLVDFLLSLYDKKVNIIPSEIIQQTRYVTTYLQKFSSFGQNSQLLELTEKIEEELRKQVEAFINRERAITELLVSQRFYFQRQQHNKINLRLPLYIKDLLPSEGPVENLIQYLRGVPILPGSLTSHNRIDFLGLIDQKIDELLNRNRTNNEDVEEEEEEHEDESEDDEDPEPKIKPSVLDIQAPESTWFRERWLVYLGILEKVLEEDLVLKVGRTSFYIYKKEGKLYAMKIDHHWPAKAFVYFKAHQLHSRVDIKRFYGVTINQISIPGHGVRHFGNTEELFDGYPIFVKCEDGSYRECQWAIKATANRPGAQCSKARSSQSRYFCAQHEKAATKNEQIAQIEKEHSDE